MREELFKAKKNHDNLLSSINNLSKNYNKKANDLILCEDDEKNKIIQNNVELINKRSTLLHKYRNTIKGQINEIDDFMKEYKKRTEKRVSIVIGVYSCNNKIFIGCHFDNTQKKYRHGKIQGCGGHVEFDESFKEGAIREAAEEHGLLIQDKDKLQFISENYNDTFNARYKYYGIDVTPEDYHSHLITTPDEIINDFEYINNIISKFPEGSIINTNSETTFLIDIDVLRDEKYKDYVYGPFHNFLKKTK